jgi:hypothetical protein
VNVRATARGRRTMERGRARRVEFLRSRLDGLSADELRVLDRAAEILLRVYRASA